MRDELVELDAREWLDRRRALFDRSERIIAEATEAAVRELLGEALAWFEGAGVLVAAAEHVPFMTLGDFAGWWGDAVDRHIVTAVDRVWQDAYRDATGGDVRWTSIEEGGRYLGAVSDRLSLTAQPTLGEYTFDRVRAGIAEEVAWGSSTGRVSERIASDLDWRGPDVGLWEARRDQATAQLERILDGVGPKGSPAREAARMNDPTVRALQEQRSRAVQSLQRDRSVWQTRAERIARTETTGAINAAQLQGIRDAELPFKSWVATADEATRETHLDAHGQCVPTMEPFTVGADYLMQPGDAFGSAEEVINCRCTVIGLVSCERGDEIMREADAEIEEERERRPGPDAVGAEPGEWRLS